MLRYLKTFVIVVLFLGLLAGPVSAYNSQRMDIWVIEDGTPTLYRTAQETVADFLDEAGIEVAHTDIMDVERDAKLTVLPRISKINITRGFDVKVIIDGKEQPVTVKPGTYTGTMIADLETLTSQKYFYDGYLAGKLEPNQTIKLQTRTEETVTETQEIPFETEVKLVNTLNKGVEEIVQEGKPGKKEIISKVVYLSGEESDRFVTEEKIAAKPVNKIINRGTRVPASTNGIDNANFAFAMKEDISNVEYTKELIMNASAYTAGYESTGKRPGDKNYGITASGARVRPGIVAVDPRVIPLGTKLYVEGYGYSIAADTGGAIKGNKIDLFFESVSEARQFGRRNIKVYVLADQ